MVEGGGEAEAEAEAEPKLGAARRLGGGRGWVVSVGVGVVFWAFG